MAGLQEGFLSVSWLSFKVFAYFVKLRDLNGRMNRMLMKARALKLWRTMDSQQPACQFPAEMDNSDLCNARGKGRSFLVAGQARA